MDSSCVKHFWLLKETHFVWLDPLTRAVNNPINIFLISLSIILYHFRFIKYLWISKISLVPIGLKSTENSFATPFNKSIVESFEILPKHCA